MEHGTRRADFRLVLVTDRRLCAPQLLVDRVAAALRGGVEAVQLREKDLGGRALFDLAAELLPLCRRAGALLLINDRIDVALAVGADGVHLPADSFPVPEARRLLGREKLIGVSTHSVREVADFARAGADFAVFGPVFETPSKASFGPPQGLARLRAATQTARLPVLAIGGVTPERAADVRATGAQGIAAITALLGTPDPASAAERFRTEWEKGANAI